MKVTHPISAPRDPLPRRFQLTLDDELAKALLAYQRTAAPGDSMQSVARELIRVALASEPRSAFFVAARRRAYQHAKERFRKLFAAKLREANVEWNAPQDEDFIPEEPEEAP